MRTGEERQLRSPTVSSATRNNNPDEVNLTDNKRRVIDNIAAKREGLLVLTENFWLGAFEEEPGGLWVRFAARKIIEPWLFFAYAGFLLFLHNLFILFILLPSEPLGYHPRGHWKGYSMRPFPSKTRRPFHPVQRFQAVLLLVKVVHMLV